MNTPPTEQQIQNVREKQLNATLALVTAVGDLRERLEVDARDRDRQDKDVSSIHEKLEALSVSIAAIDKAVAVSQKELDPLKTLPTAVADIAKVLESIKTSVTDYPHHRDKINGVEGELRGLRTVNLIGIAVLLTPVVIALFTLTGVREDLKSSQSQIQAVEGKIQQIQSFLKINKP